MTAPSVNDQRWPSRPFRWLWAASATSLIGSEIGELAVPLFALLVLDASPADLAVLRVAQFAPFLILTLVLGVLVDRMRRRPLLIFADLGRGFVLLAVVALAAFWHVPVWVLILAAALIGTLTVLYQLADFSFLPVIVPRERLADANARLSATQSLMSVAGSGAGGLIVEVLSAPIGLLTNAVTYLVSATFLSRVAIREPEQRPDPAGREPAWFEARVGIRFLVHNRVVRALAGEAATWNLFNEVLLLGLTLHIIAVYDSGPLILGGLLMLAGVGAFAGAALAGRATQRFGYGHSLVGTMLIGNTAPLALGLTSENSPPSLVLYAGALALSGFGVGLANAQAVTVRQLATPPDMHGRVNAAYRFVSWGMVAIGAIVAGVVATAWGAFGAIVLGGAGTTLATLWIILSPVRSLHDLSEGACDPTQSHGMYDG